MQNHVRRLIAVAVLAAMLAACQSIPAVGSLVPLGNGPLVSVTVRGGECPDGPCGSTTVIERDGRVHQTGLVAAEMGALSGDLLTVLDTAVTTTDFAAIRARRFTGECPVNFDGQETIYEFGAPGGTQRIATCETDVDPNHPLFRAVTAAIFSVVAEPG
jgi:hypothetical protein